MEVEEEAGRILRSISYCHIPILELDEIVDILENI